MSKLSKRLDIHFAAVAAAAGAGLAANVGTAEAAIVHTPGANIPIGADFYGVYLNVVDGSSGIPGGAVAGWDLNPWMSGGAGNMFTPTGGGSLSAVAEGGVLNLAPGTPITAAGPWDTGTASAAGLGATDPVLMGFRFTNEAAGNQVQFGWARLRFPVTGAPGIIYDYAYEDTGASINAGEIPAPGAFGLLALGAAALTGRRRK